MKIVSTHAPIDISRCPTKQVWTHLNFPVSFHVTASILENPIDNVPNGDSQYSLLCKFLTMSINFSQLFVLLSLLQCSTTCGIGKKTREVPCSSTTIHCNPSVKPPTSKSCNEGTCPTWTPGQWTDVCHSISLNYHFIFPSVWGWGEGWRIDNLNILRRGFAEVEWKCNRPLNWPKIYDFLSIFFLTDFTKREKF